MAHAVEYAQVHDNTYQVNNNSLKATTASASSVADPSWYIDSGATNHITPDINNLSTSHEYRGTMKLAVGNGHTLPISRIGHLEIISNAESGSILSSKIFYMCLKSERIC